MRRWNYDAETRRGVTDQIYYNRGHKEIAQDLNVNIHFVHEMERQAVLRRHKEDPNYFSDPAYEFKLPSRQWKISQEKAKLYLKQSGVKVDMKPNQRGMYPEETKAKVVAIRLFGTKKRERMLRGLGGYHSVHVAWQYDPKIIKHLEKETGLDSKTLKQMIMDNSKGAFEDNEIAEISREFLIDGRSSRTIGREHGCHPYSVENFTYRRGVIRKLVKDNIRRRQELEDKRKDIVSPEIQALIAKYSPDLSRGRRFRESLPYG